jgi:hypothetical protein
VGRRKLFLCENLSDPLDRMTQEVKQIQRVWINPIQRTRSLIARARDLTATIKTGKQKKALATVFKYLATVFMASYKFATVLLRESVRSYELHLLQISKF